MKRVLAAALVVALRPASVSARFKQRGARTEMYLSTLRGLSVYDVTTRRRLYVRVRPRGRARAITLRATASVKGEHNRRDNRARDTNRPRRRSPTAGAATALMASVVAPPLRPASGPARIGRFAGLRRLVLYR